MTHATGRSGLFTIAIPLVLIGITYVLALIAFGDFIPDVYIYGEYRGVVNAFTRYPLALGIAFLLFAFYYAEWERRFAPDKHQAIALLAVAVVWLYVSLRLTTTVLARHRIINLSPIQSANKDLSLQIILACIVWLILNLNLTRLAFDRNSPPLFIAMLLSWIGLGLPVLGLIAYIVNSFFSGGT